MLHGLCQPQGLTFGSTMGLIAFIMPAGEEGRYANTGQSEVSHEGETLIKIPNEIVVQYVHVCTYGIGA